MKIEIRSKEEVLVYKNQAERVSVRMLRAARPAEVSRVAQLLGGDEEMAALFILRDNGDVEAAVSKLEGALGKIAADLFADAKNRTPIDTGTLRATGAYSAGKIRGAELKKAKRSAVRLRRRLMYANFGDVIDHCRKVAGWHPDDTADILIAVDGDKARFSAAIDKWLRLENRPGATAHDGAASLLKFINDGRDNEGRL